MGAGQGDRFVELAGAHEGGGNRAADAEEGSANHFGAGGFNELGQFVEGSVGGPVAEFGQAFEADQEGLLGTRIEQPPGDIRIGRSGLRAAVRS